MENVRIASSLPHNNDEYCVTTLITHAILESTCNLFSTSQVRTVCSI